MALSAGTRVGPYEILSALGAGGMGEVYRATDTKLKRQVAIKVLPAALTTDQDRLARFQREAELLASLNHPNIAAIYGLEDEGNVRALVLELVEGPTLADRIARAPLPVAEALPIARQIADALESAHEQGIIHRDLKPANIKVRADGTAKVLDFGLAKALDPTASSEADAMNSPTLTSPALTAQGIVLGTAAYMSPEQTRGKTVDRRADIWAFGAVLFEMLTGRRPFTGETMSDMVASVLRQDIDWGGLPAETPDAVRHLLRRCLDRDVKTRLQAIGEARVVLDEAIAGAAAERPTVAMQADADSSLRPSPPRAQAMRRMQWLTAAAAVLVVAAGVAFILWTRGRTVSDPNARGAPSNRSIAVLPFVNGSGNAEDEYVADGITDELIAGLGKVPRLHVAARSSVFALKGQKIEVREVARRLGVETLLEGTVRRSGKRLRVTASLVNAADGLQLWSSSFQNDGGDTFAVQDEVTRGVVAGLALQLGGVALGASQAGRTSDPEAQDLYLRGLSSVNPSSETDLRRALQFFQQALARDPGFALAYAQTAWVYAWLADAYVAPNEAYPRVRAAARAALERDDLIADAHALLGYALSTYEWNPAAAEPEFRRALELDPNSTNTLLTVGFGRCQAGRSDEGLAQFDRMARLDPLSPFPLWAREMCFYVARRFDDVIAANRKTREIDPRFWYLDTWVGAARRELGDYNGALREYAQADANSGGPQYGLAITYARMGRQREAREILRRLDERARTSYVPFWARAAVRGSVGDIDEAVALLQRALDTRESWMLSARVLPELAAIATKDQRARHILDEVDAVQRSTAKRVMEGR